MKWNFNNITQTAENEAKDIGNLKQLEEFRIKYLGRKGLITEIYSSLPTLPKEDKPAVGKGANDLKRRISDLIDEKKKTLVSSVESDKKGAIDVTMPGISRRAGHRHILSQTINEICDIFEKLGFAVMEGPEIETEFNNFSALNIPIDHPSRDAFDTFYLKLRDASTKDRYKLLRSHTSPAQIRIMQKHKPPLAVVVPGKVYRPDAVDASHSFMFHQIEGLMVDQKVSLADLKGILEVFAKRFFGEDIKMRFRPHFFPFTEPSAEMDISCYICKGKGCSVCGRKGWLEIMGCGMVHPKVFQAVKYPKNKYSGYAFGMGVERMAMLRHGIHDIRIFFENDKRFCGQF